MQKQNFSINKAKGEMTFENQQRGFFVCGVFKNLLLLFLFIIIILILAFSWVKARCTSQKDRNQSQLKAEGVIADLLLPAKLWVTQKSLTSLET